MLALKNIAYEYKAVNLVKDGGEQHSDYYKKLNPFSYVPTLVVEKDGKQVALFESMAIIDYLEQVYPGTSVYPKDPIARATAIAVAESIVSGIQPLQNLGQLLFLESLGVDKASWAKNFIAEKFTRLEELLKTTSGSYCVGNSITIADVCLVPQTFNATRFGVELQKFPTINRIVEKLEQEEAFKAAHPSSQPDFK